jgi:hypothetical protein
VDLSVAGQVNGAEAAHPQHPVDTVAVRGGDTLVLGLGWPEEQIKIELGTTKKGRIDIACFKDPYHRDRKNCLLIVESKSFSQWLNTAHDQGKKYAAAFPACKVVVTSNGYCYKAYRRQSEAGDFELSPDAS